MEDSPKELMFLWNKMVFECCEGAEIADPVQEVSKSLQSLDAGSVVSVVGVVVEKSTLKTREGFRLVIGNPQNQTAIELVSFQNLDALKEVEIGHAGVFYSVRVRPFRGAKVLVFDPKSLFSKDHPRSESHCNWWKEATPCQREYVFFGY